MYSCASQCLLETKDWFWLTVFDYRVKGDNSGDKHGPDSSQKRIGRRYAGQEYTASEQGSMALKHIALTCIGAHQPYRSILRYVIRAIFAKIYDNNNLRVATEVTVYLTSKPFVQNQVKGTICMIE